MVYKVLTHWVLGERTSLVIWCEQKLLCSLVKFEGINECFFSELRMKEWTNIWLFSSLLTCRSKQNQYIMFLLSEDLFKLGKKYSRAISQDTVWLSIVIISSKNWVNISVQSFYITFVFLIFTRGIEGKWLVKICFRLYKKKKPIVHTYVLN